MFVYFSIYLFIYKKILKVDAFSKNRKILVYILQLLIIQGLWKSVHCFYYEEIPREIPYHANGFIKILIENLTVSIRPALQ